MRLTLYSISTVLRLTFFAAISLQSGCVATESNDQQRNGGEPDTQSGTLLPNGDRYTGSLKSGLLQGQGSLTTFDGDRYDGTFLDGLYHGAGKIAYADGDLFAGNFEFGVASGHGVMQYANGNSYQGDWQDWLFNGEGTYKDEDGAIYEGGFVDGSFAGEGTITYENGDHYAGEAARWYPHGKGVLEKANGDRYEGKFRNGKYSGLGQLRRADGALYEGKFRSGEFYGEGTLEHSIDGESKTLTGYWRRGLYAGQGWENHIASGIAAANSEELLFHQKRMLDARLESVAHNDPNKSDLYLITFAGHGQQNVFYSETEKAKEQLLPRFTSPQYSLSLVNNAKTTQEIPLATTTNLRYALANVSQKMDLENDILFLFLTSHGSRSHRLSVNLPGASLRGLSAEVLAQMLDETRIRWRVVVVSACYSGGFIPPLQNENSLIISSARNDRTSFGCSNDATLTYFGRAFFDEALPASADFESAFYTARKLVASRERKDKYEPSEPQIHVGSAIEQKLREVFPSHSHQIANKE